MYLCCICCDVCKMMHECNVWTCQLFHCCIVELGKINPWRPAGELNPAQVYSSLETKDAGFILSHVICAAETKSGRERSVAAFRRNEYCANAVSKCVWSTIKVQGPSGSLFGSVIRSVTFNVIQIHDVLVWEVKIGRASCRERV